MNDPDTACSIVPYFRIHQGQVEAFRTAAAALVERTRSEAGVLHYAFTFSADLAHCREAYVDADALLAHLDNVGDLLQDVLRMADIERLEVHGPAGQLERLREPLAALKPAFFVLECGFRR